MSGDDVLERVDPPLAEAAAARLLGEAWGIDGRLERLTGERDQNFRVTADDGRAWLLKVSHSAEDARVTDLQTAILLHLPRADASIPTPRLEPTLAGSPTHMWRSTDGRRAARLLTFLPGAPLHAVPATPPRLAAIGAVLARMDAALAGLRHPAEDHELLWDLQRASRLADRVGDIAEPDRRRLAQAGLKVFADRAERALATLPAQLIHNDLNPHNVLLAPDKPAEVTGVLDFGDAVRAPRVQDLAVAAAYHIAESGDPLAGAAALVGGYLQVLPLPEEELALLPALIVGRLALSVTIASWRARRHPENHAYIVRNMAASTLGLERLLDLDLDAAARRLAQTMVPAA